MGGIVKVFGLQDAVGGELLLFEEGSVGIAFNLERNNIGVVLLGDCTLIQEGMLVKGTGKIGEVPVGDNFLGRIVDSLVSPIDGKGKVESSGTRLIEPPAPGIVARRSVYEPLQTGIIAIDAMIPIGRGQRELIIGDRQTGKTAIAI